MRVTLVYPVPRVWIKSRTLPLGLAYIAAVLEQAGHQVTVVDLNWQRDGVLPPSDIVGVTVTTPLVAQAREVLGRAKEQGAIAIAGGPHVTCLPDEALQEGNADIVVRGEGEDTVQELVAAIEQGRDLGEVRGISFRRDGTIIHNPDRPLSKGLDEIPFPAYHLFPPLKLYTPPQPLLTARSPAANILTSRGCPYNCIFCFKGVFGRHWRPRSPENVVAEWRYLVKELGVKEIGIQDDAFNIDIDRASTICDLIVQQGLVVPWCTPNGIRADLVTEDLLRKMKASGCYRVAYGVETGSARMMKLIDKHLTLDEVRHAFALTKKVGIKTLAFFMLGNPGEDRDAMEETIKFALELDPDHAQFTIATPFPGTRLYEKARVEGKLLVDRWDDYTQFTGSAFFEYGEVTASLLKEMADKAYRRFYIRPSYALRMLSDKETWRNLPNVISGGIHFLFGK